MSDVDSAQPKPLPAIPDSLSSSQLVPMDTVYRQADSQPAADVVDAYPERANLYRLDLDPAPERLYLLPARQPTRRETVRFTPTDGAQEVPLTIKYLKRAMETAILERVNGSVFKISSLSSLRFPLIVDTTHRHVLPGKRIGAGSPSTRLDIYSAYTTRVMRFGEYYYLCVDHHLLNRTHISLAYIEGKVRGFHPDQGQRVFVREDATWVTGRLAAVTNTECFVEVDGRNNVRVAKHAIFLELTRTQLAQLAALFGLSSNELERYIKQISFLTTSDAPRARLDACTDFVQRLASACFPIVLDSGATIAIHPAPGALRPPYFLVGKDVEEVDVVFDHLDRSKRSKNILTGLTRFGAYDKPSTPLRIAIISPADRLAQMEALVERLNGGAQLYPGALRVFGGAIEIRERATADVAQYEDVIRELVRGQSRHDIDLALVYLPKSGDISSPTHPYYRTKRLLVREGLISQMVDEATVRNPNWRDFNLALNMFAKTGHAPWVLDQAIPGVDLFIGLSSSQVKRGGQIIRMMGYVNVFDSYGRWQFYQGDSAAFSFQERLRHYGELIKNSIAAYQAQHGGTLRTVQIHLTKQFSAQERRVLADAVRSVIPNCAVIFVWVDSNHPLRLYDMSSESRGYIARTTYLLDGETRLYLATTGNNVFGQKGMGTPVPVQLTIWADPPVALPPLGEIAQQIVSLTRLNWASSRNFCQEPITTKYAGDIARFMVAFVNDPTFSVNASLRDKPWFL